MQFDDPGAQVVQRPRNVRDALDSISLRIPSVYRNTRGNTRTDNMPFRGHPDFTLPSNNISRGLSDLWADVTELLQPERLHSYYIAYAPRTPSNGRVIWGYRFDNDEFPQDPEEWNEEEPEEDDEGDPEEW